jgi:hypothetical protein
MYEPESLIVNMPVVKEKGHLQKIEMPPLVIEAKKP